MKLRHKLRFFYYRATAGLRLLLLWFREPPLRTSGRIYIGGRHDVATKPGAELHFGRNVWIMHDSTVHLYGKVTIGDDCYFNRGAYIVAHDELRIGDNCIFGQRVSIHDQDHATGPADVPPGEREYVSSPIVIEDNVWVGAGAVILRGVTIGYGSVVGANSVVTKDVPARTLVAGVPARVVKQLDEGDDVALLPSANGNSRATKRRVGMLAAVLKAFRG